MNPNLNVLQTDTIVDTTGNAGVWHRLHFEREEICEALVKECGPSRETDAGELIPKESAINAACRHLELLQARLKKVDDALDRLMSGKYGDCCKCGKWIEDTKLDFDPAIAFCLACWDRMQTEH